MPFFNENVPKIYIGLSREDGREKVINDFKKLGLLEKVENYVNKIGYSERGDVPIESYLSEQWFMKMEDLAKPAMKVINEDKIKFHPNHWKKPIVIG